MIKEMTRYMAREQEVGNQKDEEWRRKVVTPITPLNKTLGDASPWLGSMGFVHNS